MATKGKHAEHGVDIKIIFSESFSLDKTNYETKLKRFSMGIQKQFKTIASS